MFPSLQSKQTPLYEPSLQNMSGYKLTSRNNDESRVDQTDKVLADNNFERIAPDLSKHSIFGALSLCLFRNQSYDGLLSKKIKDTLSDLYISGKFSMRLHSFKNNRQLVNNFSSKPYQEAYHRYVFDLTSFAFEVKVIVCSVPNHSALLTETIYANKFKRTIRLLDLGDGQYEALFPRGTFQKDKIQSNTIEEVNPV